MDLLRFELELDYNMQYAQKSFVVKTTLLSNNSPNFGYHLAFQNVYFAVFFSFMYTLKTAVDAKANETD